jgi:uncharacterized membrane protein
MVLALQVLFLVSLVACVAWLAYLGWITRHDA